MMSFCKKTIHSFLSLSQSETTSACPSHPHTCHFPSTTGCFCLIAGETQQPPNVFVLESAAIRPTSTTTAAAACKKDSTTFELHDNVCNGSCTESLGFESSDYQKEESLEEEELLRCRSMAARSRWKTTVTKVRSQEINFPPPLPSLNQNGQPCFYLKPLRRNGRLELTEVKIERPDIFRASRQNGRLRLQLIRSEPQYPFPPYQDCVELEEQEPLPLPPQQEDKEEIEEKQEKEKETEEEQVEEEEIEEQEEEKEIEQEEDDEINEGQEEKRKEKEQERRLRQWKLDGIRWRCQEVNNHRPHHLLYGAAIV